MSIRRLAYLTLAALILVPVAARAQNLLVNPGFDTDFSGWNSNIAASWDGTMDAGGSAASGSVHVEVTLGPTVTSNGGVSQCVTGIVPGTSYDFAGQVFLSESPGSGARAYIAVVWFDDAACAGSSISGSQADWVMQLDEWLPSTGSGVAPGAALAALVTTQEASGFVGGDMTVNFDDVFFMQSQAVPLLTGPWAPVLAVTLLAAGVATLRRGHVSPAVRDRRASEGAV